MIVYVFGNPREKSDVVAVQVANHLKDTPGVEFRFVAPNEDLPFSGDVVVMDAIEGIRKIRLIRDISKIVLSPRDTVHDFDLGFQLKYLEKIGKLKKVTIIGLPINKEPDYLLVQSILRKLVAQDMQGS